MQVVAHLLTQDLEYTTVIPQGHALVGSLAPMLAQALLPPSIAPFFKAAVAEGVPVVYASFGSRASQMLLVEDFRVMSSAFARMAPAKVRDASGSHTA